MNDADTPKDGDFASYLEGRKAHPVDASVATGAARQTIKQVLVEGQEPTEEFLEELNALNEAPELSDEELERQALEAGGEDGDPQTPE